MFQSRSDLDTDLFREAAHDTRRCAQQQVEDDRAAVAATPKRFRASRCGAELHIISLIPGWATGSKSKPFFTEEDKQCSALLSDSG